MMEMARFDKVLSDSSGTVDSSVASETKVCNSIFVTKTLTLLIPLFGAVVATQLAERPLLIPEVRGSNPVVGNFF